MFLYTDSLPAEYYGLSKSERRVSDFRVPIYDMAQNTSNTPVIPLPNPGEGGPVDPGYDTGSNVPVIPLPNPGEGGPVYPGYDDGSNIPVIPLPNPGEGGPVDSGNPSWYRYARTRFLNAGYGYRPFRIAINNTRVVNWLSYASVSAYGRVPVGYQTVTVSGPDGYVYIQKSMPFQANTPTTIAIINTASGLDLLQINDNCCPPNNGYSNFRVSNLALNSGPMDVLLADGRVIYTDVRYKETTAFKRIRPGEYEFFFAETNLSPMASWLDIETLDSAFIGVYPVANTAASQYLNVRRNATYTIFLLSSGRSRNAIQTMVVEDR